MSALLSFQGVSVTLGNRNVVRGVSLDVHAGDIVALLGPNGAGKTSLLRAALGLLPLAQGTARLGNDDPRALSVRERALRAAYLPQRPQSIWPLAVESVVALGRFSYGAAPDRLKPADQAAVDAALEACALTPLRARRMDEISGGEKARAHLARALAQQAPLLLLDEPTAGLDPAQALGVGDILRGHAAHGAALFSTHDVSLAARIATHVLILRDGGVVASGAPNAVMTPDALEAAYSRKAHLVTVGNAVGAVFE